MVIKMNGFFNSSITQSIILGVLATVVFEVIKFFFKKIRDSIQEKTIGFSLSGFWCSYVKEESIVDGETYYAYELLRLKYLNNKVFMTLYQVTSDKIKRYYKGYGCFRGNKLTISYEEANNSTSNHTGVFVLKINNKIEHQISLIGNYCEFRQENEECSVYKYSLYPYKLSLNTKILFRLLRKKYIYEYMQNEEFMNACKAQV